jgi:transcriptional regulator
MYRPNYSIHDDQSLALKLIQEYPLGLVLTGQDASYLPFVVSVEGNEIFLLGHLAKANPQMKSLGGPVTVHFLGPERYMSPAWYAEENRKSSVPTWSYAAVQVEGVAELILESEGIREVLGTAIEFFENRNGTTWSANLPVKIQKRLESAIAGVKIKVEKIEGKFKLGQNRPADRASVLASLQNSISTLDHEVLKWMLLTEE